MAILAISAAAGLLQHMTSSDGLVCANGPGPIPAMKGKHVMSSAVAVSTSDFDQEVLKSDLPVLVDFWAPWCMPCKMLAPTLDELADNYAGKIKVVKVNVDDNQPLASQYAVRGIPTLILFKDGEPSDRLVGVQPKAVFEEKLDKALAE
jgi:thioredoxin 1